MLAPGKHVYFRFAAGRTTRYRHIACRGLSIARPRIPYAAPNSLVGEALEPPAEFHTQNQLPS